VHCCELCFPLHLQHLFFLLQFLVTWPKVCIYNSGIGINSCILKF